MSKVRCGSLGCECACHRAKIRQAPRLWTPSMDQQLLAALDRGEHPLRIAVSMHLTPDSIKWRTKQLGRSLRDGWRSRQEVAAALGVGRRAVDRWMQEGLLRVGYHGRRWTRILDADLEAFVSAHAGLLFEPEHVTDPVLRRRADVAATVHRRRAASA